MSAAAALPAGISTPAPADVGPPPFEYFLGIVAALAGALLPLLYSPVAASETFTPKYAAMMIVAAVGLVPLSRLSTSSRHAWAARFGLLFVVVTLVSAALSPSKLVGFFGLYLWGEGAIFLAGLVSAWAIGACLGPATREWLFAGLLVGAGGNAIAAIVQTTFHLNTVTADLSGFGLFNGTQADGMMGNPIHLEAILLGALALVLGRTCRAAYPGVLGWALLVAIFGAALECSSERYGVLIVVALAAYAVVVYRRRAVAYLVALVVGFGTTFLSGAGASLGERVAASSASTTFGLRVHGALDATVATLEHRPLLGFGPGQVRNALYLYEPTSLARQLGPGRFFTDVHDLFANVLVMTGVVGLVIFVAYLVTAGWRVRGAFAGYAAASLAVALIEPMNVGVTPLAFLALGAALSATCGPAWTDAARSRRVRPAVLAAALGLVALVPGVLLVASDVLDHSAQLHFSLEDAKTADELMPIWPQTADGVVEIYNFQAVTDPTRAQAAFESSLQWARWAAARDPSDGEVWVLVGEGELEVGDAAAARVAAQRAVSEYPLGTAPLELLGEVDARAADWSGAITAFRTAHGIDPTNPTVAASLRAALAHDSGYFGLKTTP